MKKILFALSVFFFGQSAFAYDFSAVAPSGQTLYYNIIDYCVIFSCFYEIMYFIGFAWNVRIFSHSFWQITAIPYIVLLQAVFFHMKFDIG